MQNNATIISFAITIIIFILGGAVIAPFNGIAFAQTSLINNNSITSVPATATSTQNATTTNTTPTDNQASTNTPTDQPRIIKHAMGETTRAGTP
jgi:hypothetical protein